ncbi:MAG: tripartite tricarboxylate transporter TctB family protein [Sphaerochaetaceae bacterium]|nr:tripartite tricarboxylate transporter TctB family protein [Sphaerochaetaceae bacterium]
MTRSKILKIAMAIFLLAVVVAFFAGTFAIRQPRTQAVQSVSARFFPRCIIVLLAIAGALCVVQELRSAETEEDDRNIKTLALSMGIMCVCVLALDTFGFLLVGFAFLLLEIAVVSGKKPNRTSLLVAFVCSVVFTAMFRYGFNIGIPVLPFGIL